MGTTASSSDQWQHEDTFKNNNSFLFVITDDSDPLDSELDDVDSEEQADNNVVLERLTDEAVLDLARDLGLIGSVLEDARKLPRSIVEARVREHWMHRSFVHCPSTTTTTTASLSEDQF